MRLAAWCGIACMALAAVASTAEERVLLPGEIEALRAVLDEELGDVEHQRITIGRFLRLPRDTRQERESALESLAASDLADDEMIESFRRRNRDRIELWASKIEALGEHAAPGVVFYENPRQVAVQYGRMGVSASGERGLVYLELRPQERAVELTAVFRAVERAGGSWRVLPGRVGFERDGFGVKTLKGE